jgi:cytochrome c oxidase cbb3-type subunit I/II
MSARRNTLFGAAIMSLLVAITGAAQESHVDGMVGDAKSGKEQYQRYCMYCHGKFGDGRGESAAYLDPKPRDFTKAVFKCRSTPTGTLPTDQDLYDTISRGIHASGMPSWKPLTKQQRVDLVAYIKTFSVRFKEEQPGTPIQIPPEPASTRESVKRGAETFDNLNCWSCHGREGRGNGPNAITLTDSKGYPITPFDLTSGTSFKCGSSDQTLFRDLTNGLDGTPMPSFTDAMKPDQIWDVVHYIQTLRVDGHKLTAQKKDTTKTP